PTCITAPRTFAPYLWQCGARRWRARVGEHWDVAAFDLIGRGGRVLSSAYIALCRNAFSLASSSEYCLRSTSAPWYNRHASISAIAPCRVVGGVASRSHQASRHARATSLCCSSHLSCSTQ